MVGGAIRSRLIHRETYRASVLHQLWPSRGEKNTAREFCVLTTPSLLSRGTLRVVLICECARASSLDRRRFERFAISYPGPPALRDYCTTVSVITLDLMLPLPRFWRGGISRATDTVYLPGWLKS